MKASFVLIIALFVLSCVSTQDALHTTRPVRIELVLPDGHEQTRTFSYANGRLHHVTLEEQAVSGNVEYQSTQYFEYDPGGRLIETWAEYSILPEDVDFSDFSYLFSYLENAVEVEQRFGDDVRSFTYRTDSGFSPYFISSRPVGFSADNPLFEEWFYIDDDRLYDRHFPFGAGEGGSRTRLSESGVDRITRSTGEAAILSYQRNIEGGSIVVESVDGGRLYEIELFFEPGLSNYHYDVWVADRDVVSD